MKNLFLTITILLVYSYLPQASAGTKISCSHPELCRLAKIIYSENEIKGNEFTSLVKIVGDPHEYEPGTDEIKELINAPILISGPQELNPWIKKINYQRSKLKNQKTVNLSFDKKDYALYAKASGEALSHFWLYPKIFCVLKSRLEEQLLSNKLLVILPTRKTCAFEEQKIIQNLTGTLTDIKLPIVLTHDALLPLLESIMGEKANVVAIKGSGHHQETSAKSVKKLYDLLAAPKVIWIEEDKISVPENVLSKKRRDDLTVKIDTANSEGLRYFQVLHSLNEKLKEIKP